MADINITIQGLPLGRTRDDQKRDPDGKFGSGGGATKSHADHATHHRAAASKASQSGSRLAAEHHREAGDHFSKAAQYKAAAEKETHKQRKRQMEGFAARSEKAGHESAKKAELAHAEHERKQRQDRGEK